MHLLYAAVLSYLLSVCLSIHPSVRPSGFTNEHILDTLYVQRVFVGYIFIVRYTLLDIDFEAKGFLSLMCPKNDRQSKVLIPFWIFLLGCLPVFEHSCIFTRSTLPYLINNTPPLSLPYTAPIPIKIGPKRLRAETTHLLRPKRPTPEIGRNDPDSVVTITHQEVFGKSFYRMLPGFNS